MRLETGGDLPPGLLSLMRLHLLIILVVIVLAILVWLPGRAVIASLTALALVLVLVHLCLLAGTQFGVLFQSQRQEWMPGILLAQGTPVVLGVLALMLPVLWGTGVMFLATLLARLPERAPTLARLWPDRWQAARIQQHRLLMVAITSLFLALWYTEYWRLGG